MDNVIVKIIAKKAMCIPVYASELAAGADLKACIEDPLILEPGCSCLVPTGIKVELPAGYEMQVRPRSGLALKNQITVLNSPGTIDADYRGEIGVILMNHGKAPFVITDGMRIAQAVVTKVETALYVEEETLATTARGDGGFGHSGTH